MWVLPLSGLVFYGCLQEAMEDHPTEYERHKPTEDHLVWQQLFWPSVMTPPFVCGSLGPFSAWKNMSFI